MWRYGRYLNKNNKLKLKIDIRSLTMGLLNLLQYVYFTGETYVTVVSEIII